MKNVMVMGILGLMINSGPLYAGDKVVVTLGNDPGCFQSPNTGVQAAVENAEQLCQQPILRNLEVSISQVGGCNPSNVKATFVCLGEPDLK
jgi:hypothetical protein